MGNICHNKTQRKNTKQNSYKQQNNAIKHIETANVQKIIEENTTQEISPQIRKFYSKSQLKQSLSQRNFSKQETFFGRKSNIAILTSSYINQNS